MYRQIWYDNWDDRVYILPYGADSFTLPDLIYFYFEPMRPYDLVYVGEL